MKTTSVKRRKGRGRKRSFITTTYHEPKWLKSLRSTWRVLKRQTWNVFGLIGLIVALAWIARLAMGGG